MYQSQDNPELELPFEERLNTLFRELKAAIKWQRPSILLAIYSSELVRADAEDALQTRLADLGESVTHFQASEEKYDIPLLLSEYPDRDQTVFFVSGLKWGGGTDHRNAYRALNIRREYFVDFHLRVVFWLTENEAADLPSHAPDFWAFRHRAVEFVEAPSPERVIPAARELAWRDFENSTLREDIDAKIALRQALLNDIPNNKTTMATRADLLYTLGGLYWAKEEYNLSRKVFKQALRLAERLGNTRLQSWCYNALGNVYDDLYKAEEAIAAYQKAIELDPKLADPWNGLGNVYRKLKKSDEAIAAYKKAIELDPKDAFPLNGLGVVYGDLGKTDKAITAYQKAIELNPKYANPWNGLGAVCTKLDRPDEAIAAYKKAIELDAKFANPWYGLGYVYLDLDKTEDAIAAYQKAIELDSRFAAPLGNLGKIYETQRNFNEAIQVYKRFSELEPQNTGVLYKLGYLYRGIEDVNNSMDAFKNATEIAPHDALLWNGLANIYRDIGLLDEAIYAYKKAIELEPAEPIYKDNLGNVYIELAKFDDAIKIFTEMINLDSHCFAYVSLATCYRKMGNIEESDKFLQIARSLMGKALIFVRARIEAVSGNIEGALRYVGEALDSGTVSKAWIRRDPNFDFIRGDPRFKKLVGEE